MSFKGKAAIGILLCIIIISSGVYYFLYGSEEAKYSRQIKSISESINHTNKEATSTYKYMENTNANIDTVKSIIKRCENDLNRILKSSKEVKVPRKYSENHKNLINGIINNKYLYTQTLTMLDSYSSNTIESSINKLYDYVSVTIGYYEQFKHENFNVTISNEFLNFPDKINSYLEVLKSNDTTSKATENINFINILRNNINEISLLEEETLKNINLAKQNRLSANRLLVSISSSKNKLSSIINEINKLEPTEDLKEAKENLLTLVGIYDSYLSSLKTSLESSGKIESALNEGDNYIKEYNNKKEEIESYLSEKENQYK